MTTKTTDLQLPTDEQLATYDLTERRARIAWSLIAEPGDRMVHAFIAATDGDAAEALRMVTTGKLTRQPDGTADELTTALARWQPRLQPGAIIVAIKQAARYGIGTIIPGDEHWPTDELARLGDHAPAILYYRGDRSILTTPKVAIVGARAATGYGEHVTMELSAGLVDRGYTIVSGAAYGIDGMAHRAVLASQGKTIAVLAGGPDRFYPSGHDALLTRIVEHGVVISEMPPGAAPTRWRFLQRNRIIAALSQIVVVAEAGWRSGSLNTAHHAQEAGIPVGAVPGPVTSAASAGCHKIIRDGAAKLVTSADEVVEAIPA